MATTTRPKVIFGGGILGSTACPTTEDAREWLDVFRSHGHDTIDNAHNYPPETPGLAEKVEGDSGVTSWAVTDTKTDTTGEKAHSRERLFQSMDQSIESLGFKDGKGQVNVMYLHMPCTDVSFEETMKVMDEAHQKGYFKEMGISNYSPSQVEELCQISKKNGWIQPTVYQGQYNAIGRTGEKSLFPVLRKYGIRFYAYTPTGAGIFSGKVTADSINKDTGRWSSKKPAGAFYSAAYLRPELLDAASKVNTIAQQHGFNGHEAALRWILHHSILDAELGDGIIVGASSLEQFKANMDMCDKGPLPDDLVKLFEEVWKIAEPVAPWAWVEISSKAMDEQLNAYKTK